MKYSIKIVKEGKVSFFYTAHNVLLTPLPFIFIFLLLHNFIIFLPQVFYSLLRNFIMFFPLPPPRLFYIFFHPQKKSTSYRPYLDPTLNFFFVTQLREKWKKNHHISIVFPSLPHFSCFPSTTTTFLLFLSNTTTTTTTTVLLFLSSTTTTTTFPLFSLLLLFCYLSLVFLAWGWLVWPVAGLWPSKG